MTERKVIAVLATLDTKGAEAEYLREQLGIPVFSIYSFVQWFQAGLLPRAFSTRLADPR